MLLLDRLWVPYELVFGDLLLVSELLLLLLLQSCFLLGQLGVPDDVSGVLAPFAGVDRQLREHDPPQHLLLVRLESESQDLEADARDYSSARGVDQVGRD